MAAGILTQAIRLLRRLGPVAVLAAFTAGFSGFFAVIGEIPGIIRLALMQASEVARLARTVAVIGEIPGVAFAGTGGLLIGHDEITIFWFAAIGCR